MKTTLSALFAVAAAMLFAGCAAVDPVDTPPAPVLYHVHSVLFEITIPEALSSTG